MAIQFSCENCGQPIEVDDEAANQRAQCPYCRGVVQVPSISDVSISASVVPAQPTATLQTALPVPHRQGAPTSVHGAQQPAEKADRPATLGYMALSTMVISFCLFLVVMVTIMPVLMPLMPQQPGAMPDMNKMQSVIDDLVQNKPWVGIASVFFQILGITGIGLGVASLVRSERPRWPAVTVLAVVVGFIAMTICSGMVFGMLG